MIFSQDVPSPIGGFDSKGIDLGDIGFDASYGTTLPGGVVLLGGLAGMLLLLIFFVNARFRLPLWPVLALFAAAAAAWLIDRWRAGERRPLVSGLAAVAILFAR